MSKEKILVVDDDKAINKLVCSYLIKEQFVPVSAFDGMQAMNAVHDENPDLIILDVMLPDADGTDLSLEIRKYTNAPILFLSCKSQEIDKIIALSAGGDDYITKPFMPGELVARIKAHLRRQHSFSNSANCTKSLLEIGEMKLDSEQHTCYIKDREISLTSKEFGILKLLTENPRKVFTASQIFEFIWKTSCMENDSRTVMVYMSTLRKKLSPNENDTVYITNVRGVGYKFNQTLLPDK